MKIQVIKETEDYIVVCKPHGMESEHEVPSVLAMQEPDRSASAYYCVHRLDQSASGLIIYARNKAASAALSAQIRDGLLEKEYYVVVTGTPASSSGTYTDYLFHDRRAHKAYPVKHMRKGVKKASLSYRVLEVIREGSETWSLIAVKLETGRFHQIRVQFASRGMPLIGDGKYGSRVKAGYPALFCRMLRFSDPTDSGTVECKTLPEEAFPWQRFSCINNIDMSCEN